MSKVRVRPPAKRRGDVLLIVVISAAVIAMIALNSQNLFARQAAASLRAFDLRQQLEAEQESLGLIVRDKVMAATETCTAPIANDPTAVRNAVQSAVNVMNAGNTGVSFTVTASPASFGLPATFPTGGFSATSAQNLAGFAWGGRCLSLLQMGDAMVGPAGAFTFDRRVGGVSNRTHTVAFASWLVPMTNQRLVAYCLPGTPGQGVPVGLDSSAGRHAKPAVGQPVGGWWNTGLASCANGSDPDVLAGNIRNIQAASRLPYVFRDKTAFCWSGFDYVMGQTYSDRLLSAARTGYDYFNLADPRSDINQFGFDGMRPFPAEGASGGFFYPSSRTLRLHVQECGPLVYLDDASGDGTIEVRNGWTKRIDGQIVFIRGGVSAGGRRTRVRFLENTASRGTLMILQNCEIESPAGRVWTGGLWLGPGCGGFSAGQAIQVAGSYAYCATQVPANLSVTVSAPAASVMSGLAQVAPCQLVVGVQTSND